MPVLVFDCETTGLPIEKKDKKLQYTPEKYHHPIKTKYYDTTRLVELGFASMSKVGDNWICTDA